MKTYTVKLGGYDLELFTKLKEGLAKTWIDKATTSEVLRYAIYTAYCFEVDKPECATCYWETKSALKKSLTKTS